MAASQSKQQHKGVTPPISTKLPTPEELAANDALVDELKRQNNFETPAETEKRVKVLGIFQKVATEFVQEVMTIKKLPSARIKNAGGKVFTYGSYRLGVYGPGSDIDTLIVAPKDVTREDFFELFPSTLKKHSLPDDIQEMTSVADAFVPIIKLKYAGISIDLIFASLGVKSVPIEMKINSNDLLRGLDDKTLRSVNGTRVTDEIMDLVPQQKVFRTALRAIKLWAKRRAIYANVIGFPGGVAWAMLTARVCQLYPQAAAAVIVGKVFRIISDWAWPQPVLLKDIESGPLTVRVWNPAIYAGDRYHLMPIITPAYPSMCATHNVTYSTREVITRELKRGGDLVDKIFTKQAEWKDLFDRHTFFTHDFKYYLSIVSSSRTREAQRIWSGFVESKVRLLVSELEQDELISLARPYIEGFERVHRCQDEEQINAVAIGELRYQAKDIKTETTEAVNDPKHNAAAAAEGIDVKLKDEAKTVASNGTDYKPIYTTTYYIGLDLSLQAKKLDLSWATNKFKEICTQWPTYDPEINDLHVVHTRNFDLPDDVFKHGESKPAKLKKKVVKKEGTPLPETGSLKRKLEGNDDATRDAPNGVKRRQTQNGPTAVAA